ncbi:102aa long hypothetical protein [Pyrococcus horikoshii OT3]|uniref:Uncharacterized protein n=1 Tax=Pyrococcus horikoshii (strain ATCC 700860 / DSM 12428 / JCM 9974 / NBRC 100139 / OT-3) TaxID=70601 RepID=O59349_PYRHO|nr:102aa long hypothetical protein [Pyrococcus horikoshii OT3]
MTTIMAIKRDIQNIKERSPMINPRIIPKTAPNNKAWNVAWVRKATPLTLIRGLSNPNSVLTIKLANRALRRYSSIIYLTIKCTSPIIQYSFFPTLTVFEAGP